MSNQTITPPPARSRWRITRRGFLIGLGATGAGLAIGIAAGRAPFYRFMAGQLDNASAPGSMTTEPWAWFEITPDNKIIMYVGKVEMGQGIHTAIAQIGAEELGIDWEQLEVRQASTHFGPADAGTGGSNSVVVAYEPARQAAATLREMLKREASNKLGVPVSQLEAKSGRVQTSDGAKSLTYGEIVQGVSSWPELDEQVKLKDPSEFTIIGQSKPRVDFLSKLTGEAIYGYDVRVEGMLYGAVVRPPTLEAKMLAVGDEDAKKVAGVVAVYVDLDRQFAGVAAKTRAQAQAGVNALVIRWDYGHEWQQAEIEALFNYDNEIEIQREGSVSLTAEEASLSADYQTPFAVHAHLEPQSCMVHVTADKVKVWGSTQSQTAVQGDVAEALGMDAEQIEVLPAYLGGGFGRRFNIEAAVEAALLSKAAGAPVHVGWTRPEDMKNGFFRPPTRSTLRAKLENGRITEINHQQASGQVAFSSFPTFLQYIFGSDFGSWRGAFNFYEGIPNRRTTATLIELPVKTGWWRGLGLLANVFATESFMDELAHAAGADPLQFRLDHLGDTPFGQRMRGVLQAAADKAGWGQPLPEGHALGVACAPDVDTVVAQIAEISLDRTSGQIKVHKITCAVDAGLFINPDGAIAQTQGGIIMGLSSTLLEEVQFKNGQVDMSNFDRYPLLTMDMSPDLEVILLESDGQPRGMGEPPIGPVAAAVGNAFFALTGKRLRRLPFKPEYVLEALK